MHIPRQIPIYYYRRYLDAVLDGRWQEAVDLVLQLAASGYTVDTVISDLLAPVQREIGARWADGKVGIAEEHRATSIAESALDSMLQRYVRPGRPGAGDLVLCAAEGEWHSIAARMVALVLEHQGWSVTLVVPSVPAEALVDIIGGRGGDLVGVSCVLPANLYGAWRVIDVLRRQDCQVIVGGRALGSGALALERSAALGADGFAADAMSGARVLRELAARPVAGPRAARAPSARENEASALHGRSRKVLGDSLTLLDGHWPDLVADPQIQPTLAQDMELLLKVLTSAVLLQDQALLDEHLDWYRSTHISSGVAVDLADLQVGVIARCLPHAEHPIAHRLLADALR